MRTMLKIQLRTLRALVREEVERNMRWSAGFGPGGLGRGNGRPAPLGPEPGLGGAEDDIDIERENGEKEPWWEQTIPQAAGRED